MLRSRDTSKNAHQRNGIQIDEPATGSSFTKWGILVCVLFIIVIAYFVFMDNNNTTTPENISKLQSASSTTQKHIATVQSLSSPNAPISQPIVSMTKNNAIASQNHILPSKLSRNTFSTKRIPLRPKVLGDLNPIENDKLQRLMDRQNMLRKKNKLNPLFPGVGPLKSLTGPRSEFVNAADANMGMESDTKEVSFVLHATSLPKSPGKQPSIFIRQTYPVKGEFTHDFVLIFLHGAAYSSATWSELGILHSLAQQGYVSYALDVPNYGQSVKIQATNNKWLREIIEQLVGGIDRVDKHIAAIGGMNTPKKKYILITASMSGRFAIPLLLETPKDMVGMITIAPVGTDRYNKQQYEKVKIPVCIIYGEEDKNLGVTSKENLIQIPNHKSVMVPGGSHAAYKSDPKFFHRQVVKWLNEFFD